MAAVVGRRGARYHGTRQMVPRGGIAGSAMGIAQDGRAVRTARLTTNVGIANDAAATARGAIRLRSRASSGNLSPAGVGA